MGLKSHLMKRINGEQIKALLWKDVLIRCRQPWMTAIQYIWPCLIFIALYALRLKFQAEQIPNCQFPTRQLPSPTGLLPFFQSYICTIENECRNISTYNEISEFEESPITPIVHFVQTFLNEDALYNAIHDLPVKHNFLGAIQAIAGNPKFPLLQAHIGKLIARVSSEGSPIDGSFNITELWSNDMTFSRAGSVICGKPFPRSTNVRLIDRVFYQEDFNGANQEELNIMPTNYCKQLYLDVTGTNNGKITWNYIKPIIQGKILYGPINAHTEHIMKNANDTLLAMNRLKDLVRALDTSIQMLRVDGPLRGNFTQLMTLANSPLGSYFLTQYHVDKKMLDTIFDALLHDKQVSDITSTIANIFECFSVDRFVRVESQEEMEEVAIEMNKKKLFLAGVYFDNDGQGSGPNLTDHAYTLRMDIDNTPITLENRNRLWFPGPDASFELQMRYHRGFIQIQHIVDQAITKTVVELENQRLEEEWNATRPVTVAPPKKSIWDDEPEDEEEEETANEGTTTKAIETDVTTVARTNETEAPPTTTENIQPTTIPTEVEENRLNSKPETDDAVDGSGTDTVKRRKKRSPQVDFLSLFFGGGGSGGKADANKFNGSIKLPDQQTYTKQLPYPAYRKDSFLTGLYLAQSIQLAFFFALIIQVSAAVRQRIWMRESGNSTLMRIMGMERTSENMSWVVTTLVEMAIVFLLCQIILYAGGTLRTTNPFVLYLFLLIFALCVIAFCYMISTFFSSASIGSVSAVIFFLMTYMPYIVIIALGTTLSACLKFLASLSISTAFCYAWRYILRLELQQREFNFSSAFEGSFESNDFKFGITMIVIDLILYTIVGYLYERFTNDEFKFHQVPTKDMDIGIGGALHNCTKTYEGSERPAIDNVSILFRRDYITCLLGRNGAGKSTIIKLLTGQIAPSSGHVFWPLNWDRITGNEFDDRIGLCPQNNILIPNLTAKEHLQLYVRIKSGNKNTSSNRSEVERVMRSLQFGKHEDFYSQNLSGGFKRRLNVAIAFIASPNLVILDEPCSGVDTKARRNIWDLISVLRKSRAVVLATHYLDEAEHLSDSILIMNEGKVMAEHDPDSLKDKFTRSFELQIKLKDSDKTKIVEELRQLLQSNAPDSTVLDVNGDSMNVSIPYRTDKLDYINYTTLLKAIEHMESENSIRGFRIVSSNLEQIFNDLVLKNPQQINGTKKREEKVVSIVQERKLSESEVMTALLKKRFLHFKRNYRLILTVLVLPTIFVMIAMGFMTLRPPGEHDVNLHFSRDLYANTMEFYSLENGDDYQSRVYENLHTQCGSNRFDTCTANPYQLFNSSEKAYKWVLDTHEQYIESRYGGVSINDSRSAVWYNNKGYHAMPVYLNQLNMANLQSAMNNSEYRISTNNYPLKLGEKELTMTSILQQVADAGISLILLVAFSLVVAGSSVYIVTERLNGEKLQQKLCGVSFKTYWGVSFLWDYTIFIVALLLAIVVFKCFDIPVYTAKHNLHGIVALLLLFGFASIPMVHLFEKLFTDASLANMYLLCMNIIIALVTVTVIVLFDVLGESDESERIRNFLNRAFLVLPQHALADGLVEICRNFILFEVFERYYINTYKSPITSDLLLPHYSALICLGIVFITANYIIESGRWRTWTGDKMHKNRDQDLQTITTVQQNGAIANGGKKHELYNHSSPPNAMEVESLCKTYDGRNLALKNVTFDVKSGECFGLLGANGAGKSTIFGILSSQLAPTSGTINIDSRDSGISYCPQTNPLDNLLTTQEIINFYARLRKIQNIPEITEHTLETYHLLPYRNVLVKNLSGGNRRKLSVAVACFGATSNVLMDEPTSDMDPITRSIVYASINRLLNEKRSVVLTSHTITEIDRVCGRIGVLRQGEMIVVAPPQQLKMMYGNCYAITIYFDQIEALTIEREIKKIHGAENVIVHSHCLQFRIKIKSPSNIYINNNNNTSKNLSEHEIASSVALAALGEGIVFSDLINTLHALASDRGIAYTITECLLDQAFDRVLEADAKQHSYTNGAYQSETPT